MLLLLLQADAAQDYTLSASSGTVTITGQASQRAANLDAQPGAFTITGGAVGDIGYTLAAGFCDVYIDAPDAALQLLEFTADSGSLVTTFPDVTLRYEQGSGGSNPSLSGGGGGTSRQPRGASSSSSSSFKLREDLKPNELEDIYDRIFGIKKPDPVVKAAIKAVERVSNEIRPEPADVDWAAVAADEAAAQALAEADDALDAFEAMEALLTMLAWDEAA